MTNDTVYKRLTSEMSAHLQIRRLFFAILTASLTCNVFLAGHIAFTGDTSKTVVLAPDASTTYWAQSDKVSPNLLERFVVTSLDLILNMNPVTAQNRIETFLAATAPESTQTIEALLKTGREELMRAKAAVAFFPEGVSVDPETGSVCVKGERRVMIARTVTSTKRLTVCAGTVVRSGRVWITHLKETQNPV